MIITRHAINTEPLWYPKKGQPGHGKPKGDWTITILAYTSTVAYNSVYSALDVAVIRTEDTNNGLT